MLTLFGIVLALILAGGAYLIYKHNKEEEEPKFEDVGPPDAGPDPEDPFEEPVDSPIDSPELPTPDEPTKYPDHPVDHPRRRLGEKLPERVLNALEENGVESVEDLRDLDDLTELDGIGEAYAEDITQELEE